MGYTRINRLIVALATAALLVVALTTFAASSPASAQACDPIYGCEPTTTTADNGPISRCEISATSGRPGQRIDVTITNVPEGMEIDLLFGGTVVASATAGPGSGAEPGYADVPFSFVIPDVPPGRYTIEAVGAAFSTECAAEQGGFGVLADTDGRPGGGGTGGGGSGGGNLARTGIAIALLLAIALALVVAGRAVVESSRRSRRAASEAPRGKHAARDPGAVRSDR